MFQFILLEARRPRKHAHAFRYTLSAHVFPPLGDAFWFFHLCNCKLLPKACHNLHMEPHAQATQNENEKEKDMSNAGGSTASSVADGGMQSLLEAS